MNKDKDLQQLEHLYTSLIDLWHKTDLYYFRPEINGEIVDYIVLVWDIPKDVYDEIDKVSNEYKELSKPHGEIILQKLEQNYKIVLQEIKKQLPVEPSFDRYLALNIFQFIEDIKFDVNNPTVDPRLVKKLAETYNQLLNLPPDDMDFNFHLMRNSFKENLGREPIYPKYFIIRIRENDETIDHYAEAIPYYTPSIKSDQSSHRLKQFILDKYQNKNAKEIATLYYALHKIGVVKHPMSVNRSNVHRQFSHEFGLKEGIRTLNKWFLNLNSASKEEEEVIEKVAEQLRDYLGLKKP